MRVPEVLEEITHGTRRETQSFLVLLYAGPDEPVQVAWRQLRRELLHERVELGVTRRASETGLFVAFNVRGGHLWRDIAGDR